MSFLKRDLALLGMFGVIVFSFTDCSLLTKVDWTAIPPPGAGGTGGEAGDHGEAGSAGASEEAGAGGVAGEGGAGGEGGEGGNPDETGGFGGNSGGSGGTAGKGGSSGGGGSSGSSGSPATGGSGTVSHLTCSTAPTAGLVAPSSISASAAMVFFDGGTGESGNRMGRAGLDAACAAAKTKLQLQHSKTHAVISVDLNDQILDMPEHYGIPRQSRPIVSSVGLEVAKDWNTLWTSPGDSPSLVCSGVMPPSSLQWLTGTSNKKQTGVLQDATVAVFGLWDFSGDLSGTAVYNNACNGWTLGVFDSVTSAHVGSTIADHDNGSLDVHPRLFDYLVVSCAKATGNILCIAYEPTTP